MTESENEIKEETETDEGPVSVLPPRPRRIDSAAVYDLLSLVAERFSKSVDLQIQMAETIIFVKDEVVSLRDKHTVISNKIKHLEQLIDSRVIPTHMDAESMETISALDARINSALLSVNSMKDDVIVAVKSASDRMESDRMLKFVETTGRLSGEIRLLHAALAVESDDE